jgi:murein DD-endopeptidase MepM/ murein hydrolase activator NlpD
MPAHGQHRKPRAKRLTRVYVAAGTGGAALALPLVTAGHAAAAPVTTTAPANAAPANASPADAAPAQAAPAAAPASAPTRARTYAVVRGDTLSAIARTHDVGGGWHQLYSDNKSVVGADPNLIRPGQRLSLSGAAATTGGGAAPAPAPSSTAGGSTAGSTSGTASSSGWTKPVGDAPIGTGYHVAGSSWASGYHTGVDFVVGSGTAVHAVGAGTVVSAGWDGSYGNDVIIKHDDGRYTLYGHLSQVQVSAGQTVTEDQQIGLSGATGNATGPHLHFEVRTTPDYGSDIDPVAYLASHGVTV